LAAVPPPTHKSREEPAPPSSIGETFHRLAAHAATVFGTPWAFAIAVLVVVGWAATGPLFHFSETWQLVINTGTTIITFLMVFLIQSTQNRDARAIHLKLDELIRCTRGARDAFADLEEATDEELDALQHEFEQLRKRRGRRRAREPDQQPQRSAPDKDRPT
jgi:low affinity Fe/Cu permease